MRCTLGHLKGTNDLPLVGIYPVYVRQSDCFVVFFSDIHGVTTLNSTAKVKHKKQFVLFKSSISTFCVKKREICNKSEKICGNWHLFVHFTPELV